MRRQLGVAHRVLNVLVPEVDLQGAGIVAFVGEGKAAGMAQHVRVGLEAKLGRRASALDHAGKAGRGERGAASRGEHERGRWILLSGELQRGPVWDQVGTKKGRPSGRLFSWLLLLRIYVDRDGNWKAATNYREIEGCVPGRDNVRLGSRPSPSAINGSTFNLRYAPLATELVSRCNMPRRAGLMHCSKNP